MAWTVHPGCIVPAIHDRKTIRYLAIAAAELDCHRAIGAFLGRDTIDGIGIVSVLFEVTLSVVDADRPKCIDGNVTRHGQLVDRLAA